MDWYKLVEGEISKGVASVIAMVFIAIVTFFRKLPHEIIENYRYKKHLIGIKKGSKINVILSDLAAKSGTIYVVIWRYHNGGPNRMTVDWEETGHICTNCVANCRNYREIPRLQNQWKGIHITEAWHRVIEKTLLLKGEINTVNYSELDGNHQQLWNDAKIHVYKEVLIKHKKFGFYTLGLSFCIRFKDYDDADGIMSLAARQLKNLL